MSVESTSARLHGAALDFAWDQWSQMGVSGASSVPPDRRAADPEALLLFTLDVGRRDPRLFDEVLDWLAQNHQLLSVRRLKTLCIDATDRSLLQAALAWVDQFGPRARLQLPSGDLPDRAMQPLFLALSGTEGERDPSFEAAGWIRPPARPSGKSMAPDLRAPINLAFQLRRLLGVGARAEVVRALLTIDAAWVSRRVVLTSSAFTEPNVRESLNQLAEAGVLARRDVSGEQQYGLRRADWWQLLDRDRRRTPRHEDWIPVLGALRRISRWLEDVRVVELSEYMRSSESRDLLDQLAPTLRFAGIDVDRGPDPMGGWLELEAVVNRLADRLAGPR